jgi:K+-transporting ATPase A subunit
MLQNTHMLNPDERADRQTGRVAELTLQHALTNTGMQALSSTSAVEQVSQCVLCLHCSTSAACIAAVVHSL